MIPRTIHFFWLSGSPFDKVTDKCIASWKKHLNNYEIIKWDYEKCKDIIESNTFAREAYSVKKWAFVSDYLRLYMLYNYGGIYMDADVEVVKNLDCFLPNRAFTCYETKDYVAVTLVGCEKGNPLMKELLDYYENRHFIKEDGSYDMRPNPGIVTDILKLHGFIPDGKEKDVEGLFHIYTKDYFCPIDLFDRKDNCYSSNTYAIHLFNGAWQPRWRHYASRIKKYFGLDPKKFLGEKLYKKIRG